VAILPRRAASGAAADGPRPFGRLGGPRIHDWEAARRATSAAKLALAVGAVAVTAGGLGAAPASVAVAAGWAGLVLLEWRVGPGAGVDGATGDG
jgi:hypothetical protein